MEPNKKKAKPKEEDPEALMRKKFRAKCQFRALGRLVIENRYWLIEGIDEYEGLDVKRRVEQAVRAKHKKKQLLNTQHTMEPNKKKAKPKEEDPEALMRKKFRAKCQFRALGRLVIENRYWLIEGIDEYEGLDVKRRVEQAVRAKHKKKQLLNTQDKALLNKCAEERTVQEQRYLYRILGGLKCFKRYPNHVKKKLAAVTYFKYYGPNRVIVRQHQEARALYFVVTGEVTVSQLCWDELLQQHVSVDVGKMTAGDMFGEVSLLHNIPRTATVTTNGHCELLALMKEDFKNVLQASVQEQWDEVRLAMERFTYFDGLDEVARREGCIVAKMKSYAENETLLGDGVGVANFVYFVLSGRCQMIESLQVIVKTHLGRSNFTLYDPYVPQEESEKDLETKWFAAYKSKLRASSFGNQSDTFSAVSQSQYQASKGLLKRVSVTIDKENEPELSPATLLSAEATVPQHHDARKHSARISVEPEPESKKNQPQKADLRTYFMQVCIFNPGSTFGFGENMRDRRIVALTPVVCLLLPKIWLLQRNTANIWSRIQHYLQKKIPTKQKLFKEFVSARRWQEFREQIVGDVVAQSNAVNFTTVHDVPYSVRMEEMLDI